MFYRTALILFIILSLLTLTIFAAPQAAAQMRNHNIGCIASALNGAATPCPIHNLLGFINFHLDAFKNFSRVVFQTDLILLLTFLFLFLALCATTKFLKTAKSPFSSFSFENFSPAISIRNNFIRWLAIHENSPNSFSVL